MLSTHLKCFQCSIEFGGEYIEAGAQFIVNDVDGTAESIAKDMELVNEYDESYQLRYQVRIQLVSNSFSEHLA